MNFLGKLKSLRVSESGIKSYHFWAVIALFALTVWFYFYYGSMFSWKRPDWIRDFFTLEYIYRIHGSLFCLPFIYAAIAFRWRGALIIWIISMAAMLPRMLHFSYMLIILIQNILYAAIPLTAAMFVFIVLTWREKERRIMAEREEERQVYVYQIFKAQEDERQRIAQELHDDTMQTIVAIAQRAQTLLSNDNMKELYEECDIIKWVRDNLLQVTEDLRRLSLDLRPGVLDNMGLVPAIRWLVGHINQETDINTRVTINGDYTKLKPENDVVVFRLVQEALNNIRKHSDATKAYVDLEFNAEHMKISVKDNGKGFNVPTYYHDYSRQGKLGIIGMRERVNLMNGDMNIESNFKAGTSVTFKLNIA